MYFACHSPKKWSKYRLHFVRTLTIVEWYLWKSIFAMPENAEVSFDTSEENQLSYVQNGYFFKILWWCHEPHNQVKKVK